ncbi:MAG: hypothetical protein ABFD79_17570 [Phycisphaerales bacterium]
MKRTRINAVFFRHGFRNGGTRIYTVYVKGENLRKGSLMTETMVALALLGVIMFCMAIGMRTFGGLNQYLYAKQRCISAAWAQLDSIKATGRPIIAEDNERLWPRVKIQIEQSDGTGQWEGLKLMKVKAETMSMGNHVQVEMARYFAEKKK